MSFELRALLISLATTVVLTAAAFGMLSIHAAVFCVACVVLACLTGAVFGSSLVLVVASWIRRTPTRAR